QVVEQGGELRPLTFPCCLAHTRQSLRHANLALCRVRGRLMGDLLDQRPSLLSLRRPLPVFVRVIHRYYAAVRSLADVRAGRTAICLPPPACGEVTTGVSEVSRFSCVEFLDVYGVCDYAGLAQNSRYRSGPCCLPL